MEWLAKKPLPETEYEEYAMQPLTTDQIASAALPDWSYSSERGGCLSRSFVFADFVQAFGPFATTSTPIRR